MVSLILLIIGTLIILFSIIFIKYQSSQNSEPEEFNQNNNELVYTLESLENIIDDINITINSTINEMEKKYEILESKIQQVDVKASENDQTHSKPNSQSETYYQDHNNNIEIQNNLEKKNEGIDGKSSKIIELKRKGLSIPQIAKELNMGIGEVMLILNLKRM